mmetsp:Transcript_15081/g.35319  ORF Transcript_15081/g.35319 Transcript_15081/m.35319 type:complete len:100 (-) Transcript_15081:145-444(-)
MRVGGFAARARSEELQPPLVCSPLPMIDEALGPQLQQWRVERWACPIKGCHGNAGALCAWLSFLRQAIFAKNPSPSGGGNSHNQRVAPLVKSDEQYTPA